MREIFRFFDAFRFRLCFDFIFPEFEFHEFEIIWMSCEVFWSKNCTQYVQLSIHIQFARGRLCELGFNVRSGSLLLMFCLCYGLILPSLNIVALVTQFCDTTFEFWGFLISISCNIGLWFDKFLWCLSLLFFLVAITNFPHNYFNYFAIVYFSIGNLVN